MFWFKKPMPAQPRNTTEAFLAMRLVSSRVEETPSGDLVRVEVRKCDTTNVVLQGRFKVPERKPIQA